MVLSYFPRSERQLLHYGIGGRRGRPMPGGPPPFGSRSGPNGLRDMELELGWWFGAIHNRRATGVRGAAENVFCSPFKYGGRLVHGTTFPNFQPVFRVKAVVGRVPRGKRERRTARRGKGSSGTGDDLLSPSLEPGARLEHHGTRPEQEVDIRLRTAGCIG